MTSTLIEDAALRELVKAATDAAFQEGKYGEDEEPTAETAMFAHARAALATAINALLADRTDLAKRLRSLAKDERLVCRCQATSGYKHVCEPCRALARAEQILEGSGYVTDAAMASADDAALQQAGEKP